MNQNSNPQPVENSVNSEVDPQILLFFAKRMVEIKDDFDKQIESLKTEMQSIKDAHSAFSEEHTGHMNDLKKMVQDAISD